MKLWYAPALADENILTPDSFYDKAFFNDNKNFESWGGGVRNDGGTFT